MPDIRSTPRSRSGVPGLDDVLHGGYIPGRFYLVDGNAGAGKTTLALHYLMQGLQEGERVLYLTLAETAEELREGASSHGWSLARSSLRYRRQVLALKHFFVHRGCTVLLLDDRTAEGADLQLQSIAHGVMSLEHNVPRYGPALRQLRVVKFRGSDFISGAQDMALGRGGLRVFPRPTAADHSRELVRDAVPSGVARLDALLGGGIDRGTTTLVMGPPGAGKSTIAAHFAVAACQRGDHAVVFAFEEGRSLLLTRLAGLGLRINPGKGPGQLDVVRINPAEVLPSEFACQVRNAVERQGARVIVIDSLNGYLNAMPEERALTTQLHELLTYLNNHGVATFLVSAQAGMFGPSMRSPVDASYLADSVMLLRLFEHKGSFRRAISVVKKRTGSHEDTICRVWFDSQGVHLSGSLLHLRGVLTGVPVEVGPEHEDAAQGLAAHAP